MSKNDIIADSQTDLEALRAMKDEDIDLSDSTEFSDEDMQNATFRVNMQTVAKTKKRVSIMLDPAILAYFRAKAGQRGYQTLINQVLAESINREELEEMLRRIVREELQITSAAQDNN